MEDGHDAAGVLAVCLGKATKYVDRLMDTDKRYIAEVTFGVATDTQDAYGVVTEQSDKIVTEAEILAVLPRFVGSIEQRTPLYSAAKQDGVPLYKLARSGREIREKLRTVQISSVELLRRTGDNSFLLDVCCGKGTYIRTLAAEFAQMAAQVEKREQELRKEVFRLQIEIDEAKRERQVSEIVESDYFQSLRSQAKKLRGQQ